VIADDAALAAFMPQVEIADRVAIDTEADSLHCYFEKLCLVQVSLPGLDELIDPLAPLALAPFFRVVERKLIILHGADFDMRMLRRAGLQGDPEVFDTMIASRLCGHTEFSLAALLKRFFNLELAKGSQKANWARRPLTPVMLEYAVNDTRYLLELSAILEAELVRLGRLDWHRQMSERVVAATKTQRQRDPDAAWRITGSHELRGRSAAILRALWNWRDGEARKLDRPAFHIMQNTSLIENSRLLDAGQEPNLAHLRGGRLDRFHEAVTAVMALPETEWPQRGQAMFQRMTPDQEEAVRRIKQGRDAKAKELELDPTLIASKAVLEALVRDPEATKAQLLPWQAGLLGLT